VGKAPKARAHAFFFDLLSEIRVGTRRYAPLCPPYILITAAR